jgi:eukaryotic-like serine/threonine-protein kinase
MWLRPPRGAAAPSVLQLALLPPAELRSSEDDPFGLALAPDGHRIAFPGTRNGVSQLWLRDLSRDDLQPLPGTEAAVQPFWSPDGTSLGFFAAGKMRIFVFADAVVRDLVEAVSPRGAVWHANGDIIYAPAHEGGLMVRRADGRIEPFTTVERDGEVSHRYPSLMNEGGDVIFFVQATAPTREGVWIAPFDQPAARKRLAKSDASAVSVGDWLIFSSEGALVVQRLDGKTRALSGRPALLDTVVGRGPQHQLFATRGADVLIYGVSTSGLRELRWFDRSGTSLGTVGEPMDARAVRIDPSGDRVAVARTEAQLSTLDIYTYEAARPVPRRMSLAIDADESPVWSADGRRLAWVTGGRSLTVRDAAAATEDVTLRKFGSPIAVTDWSQPAWIVVSETRPDTRSDVLIIAANDGAEPRVYANSPFNERDGTISPDGRWLVYASDESGQFELYLDSFPTPGQRARLTAAGGAEPRWSRNGNEIFFRRGSEIHVVRPQLTDGVPVALSSQRLFDAGADILTFDADRDGQRFLLNLPAPDSAPKPMTVIVNVVARLAELVPPERR